MTSGDSNLGSTHTVQVAVKTFVSQFHPKRSVWVKRSCFFVCWTGLSNLCPTLTPKLRNGTGLDSANFNMEPRGTEERIWLLFHSTGLFQPGCLTCKFGSFFINLAKNQTSRKQVPLVTAVLAWNSMHLFVSMQFCTAACFCQKDCSEEQMFIVWMRRKVRSMRSNSNQSAEAKTTRNKQLFIYPVLVRVGFSSFCIIVLYATFCNSWCLWRSNVQERPGILK